MTKKKKYSYKVDEDVADVDGAGLGPHGPSLHPPGLDLTLRQYTKSSKVGHLNTYSGFFFPLVLNSLNRVALRKFKQLMQLRDEDNST